MTELIVLRSLSATSKNLGLRAELCSTNGGPQVTVRGDGFEFSLGLGEARDLHEVLGVLLAVHNEIGSDSNWFGHPYRGAS